MIARSNGLRFVLGVLACLSTVAATPSAAFCRGWEPSLPGHGLRYYTPSNEFRRSRYVVTAALVDTMWVGTDRQGRRIEGKDPKAFDALDGWFYTLRIKRTLKGRPPATIRLFSENTTARFEFAPRRTYLVFVDRQMFDKPYGWQLTIDSCGNTAAFPKVATALRRLRYRR